MSVSFSCGCEPGPCTCGGGADPARGFYSAATYRPRLRREIQPIAEAGGIRYRATVTTGHIDVNRPQGRPIVRVPAWRAPDEDGASREPGAFFRSDGRLFKRAPRATGYDRDEPLPIPPVFR